MNEEKILQKADGTFVLTACKTVGINHAYPHVKCMHGFTDNGFPKGQPVEENELSIWSMFGDSANRFA